jgi:hypothetical protein
MFRKTIAVLLVFLIVLSSCGKKDKDKSNDFLRTAPIETLETPVKSLTSALGKTPSPVASPIVVTSVAVFSVIFSFGCAVFFSFCYR